MVILPVTRGTLKVAAGACDIWKSLNSSIWLVSVYRGQCGNESCSRGRTKIGFEVVHSPLQDFAHLAEIYSVEEVVLWVRRDINFLDAIFCPTEKDLASAEGVSRANGEVLEDLADPFLGRSQRVEECFSYSLHFVQYV